MADLARIKENVAKMASMNAPVEDIDGYIASEGTTVDAIKAFKPQMFATEAEGRQASEVAFKEQKRLQGEASPLAVAGKGLANTGKEIVGGINTALNTATAGATDIPYQMAGTTNVPAETGDIAKGAGMGLGMVGGIPGAVAKGAGAMLANTGLWKAPGQYMAMGRELKALQAQYGKTAEGVKVPMTRLADHIGEAVVKAKDKLGNFKKEIDNAIFSESEKAASFVHSKLPPFFKKASKEYGDRLEEIAQFADETGKITRKEAHEFVSGIKQEAISKQLDIGKAYDKVDEILKGYPLEGEPSIILSEKGTKTIQDLSQDLIPFKDFNASIREVMKKTGATFKSGQRVSPEDLAAMITKEHYGQFLESKVSSEVAQSLKQLNADYKPIAQARQEAGRIFNPYLEFKEGQGSSWLAKVAENTAKKDLSIGEQKLLSLLEEGNAMGEGVGDVTSTIRALGKQKASTVKDIENTVNDLVMKQNKVKDYEATRASMNKKVGWALGILGIGGLGGASQVYRAGRQATEFTR